VFRGEFGRAGSRACSLLSEAELSATSPHIYANDTPRWQNLVRQVRRTSFGGDCYAYGLVALGQIDIVAEATMQIWDWAALVPVIEGAGGSVTDWNGDRLRPDGDGRVLALGDPALLAQAKAALAA
jgi:fructose-1,6-bisphosphatase/inositol monophosphatase family enzyme